jgi:hypothetical protein
MFWVMAHIDLSGALDVMLMASNAPDIKKFNQKQINNSAG